MALLTLAVSALAGCSTSGLQTMPPERYQALQMTLRNDPAFRRWATADCIARYDAAPMHLRRKWAAMDHVSLESYSRIRCKKLFRDVASGHKTYEDYKKMGT